MTNVFCLFSAHRDNEVVYFKVIGLFETQEKAILYANQHKSSESKYNFIHPSMTIEYPIYVGKRNHCDSTCRQSCCHCGLIVEEMKVN